MSNLVDYARRELELIGEEPDTIDSYLRVVQAFADMDHSGCSASVAIPVLQRLLSFKPLSDLTSDPAEWMNVSEAPGDECWQSRRDPTAFSSDGGLTYYLLEECDAAGSMETTPLHRSVEVPA